VLEARVLLQAWIDEYNLRRPHRGLGMKTPDSSPRSARRAGHERNLPHSDWTSRFLESSSGGIDWADERTIVSTSYSHKNWTKSRGLVTRYTRATSTSGTPHEQEAR
jgi:hypothetical protein